MPLKKCTKDGKSGWKWGDSGACYTQKDAKKRTIRQGIAIDPKKFKQEMSKGEIDELMIASSLLAESGDIVGAMVVNELVLAKRTKTVNINANSESEALKTAESGNSGYRAVSANPKSKNSDVYEVTLVKE